MLLLPSATYRATELLAAARRAGTEVVTASDDPQVFAEGHPERHLELDFDEPSRAAARIVAFSNDWPLDAVLALDDAALESAALANEALGLRHSPPAAVAATRDKARLRTLLDAREIDQPDFEVLAPEDPERQADGAVAAGARLGWPVVVKPAGLSGSRGVIRADDAEAARAAARRAHAIALEARGTVPTLLVESFVPGDEVAVDGLHERGRLRVLAVFDKPDPLDGPYFEESIYLTPSRHDPRLVSETLRLVEAACAAIGLTEGPVHAEVRLTTAAPRRPVLIEVAARSIGGRCAKALRFAAGRSLEDLVVAHALGRGVDHPRASVGAAGVLMLPIPHSGRLVAVEGVERARAVEHITGLELTVPIGSYLKALPEGDRYLGFLFARGPSPAAVDEALREAHGELVIEVAAGEPGPADLAAARMRSC